MLIIRKSRWRERWYVYQMGHTEGDYYWMASFRFELDAFKYINNTGGFRDIPSSEASQT